MLTLREYCSKYNWLVPIARAAGITRSPTKRPLHTIKEIATTTVQAEQRVGALRDLIVRRLRSEVRRLRSEHFSIIDRPRRR